MKRHTPDNISSLEPGEVFVFGSNLAGHHGGGAALLANRRFGACYGYGEGLQGRSYALPTLDSDLQKLLLPQIEAAILIFVDFVAKRPDLTFLVTKIGCGIAGYSPAEIAPLWPRDLPNNIILPLEFSHEQN